MSISCLSCTKKMHTVFYHGVNVKFCLPCKSFFLKPEDLHKIKESEEAVTSQDTTKQKTIIRDTTCFCPECGEVMVKQDYGKVVKTVINICNLCNGIWLNKGELNNIQTDYIIVKQNQYANKTKRNQTDITESRKKTSTVKEINASDKFWRRLGLNEQVSVSLKSFLDTLHYNIFTNFLMKLAGWILIGVCVYLVWLVLLYIFNNISTAPPKPTGFDQDLSRVSIFYIFSIALAGPVLLGIVFVLWRLFWYSLYGPIQEVMHCYFHPLIKPLIAICLLLLVLQSVSLFAYGFWTSYWWLNQQVENASQHSLQLKEN